MSSMCRTKGWQTREKQTTRKINLLNLMTGMSFWWFMLCRLPIILNPLGEFRLLCLFALKVLFH
jgi:hypothetical protein